MAIRNITLSGVNIKVDASWENNDGKWEFLCVIEDPAIEDVYDGIRSSNVSESDIRDAIDYLVECGSKITGHTSEEVCAVADWAREAAIKNHPKADAYESHFGY